MIELALKYGGGPVSSRTISRRQALPEKYAERLLQLLRQAGLVRSVRGASGGYMLARPPNEITVGETVRALDGLSTPPLCGRQTDAGCAAHGCASCDLWQALQRSAEQMLEGITVAELAARQREAEQRTALDYCI